MHRCNSSELFSPTNFAKFTDENPESNTSRVSSITARVVDHGVMFHLGGQVSYYPAGSACHLIQSTVNEVEKHSDDSFL